MKAILVKLSNLFVWFALFALAACQDEDLVKQTVFGLEEKDMALSFEFSGIVTVGDESRATTVELTEDEQRIHSGVLLQFHEDGSLLKKYELKGDQINNSDCKVRLYVPKSGELLCAFAANTTLAEMGLDGDKRITQADLNTVARKINSYDDLIVDATHGLLMSAKANISSEISKLNFNLKPNVAKLVFSVQTTGTEQTNHISKIYSIQVKNVHSRVLYALHAADKAYEYKVDANVAESRINYDPVIFPTPLEPNSGKGVLPPVYVPHNMAGAYVNKADTKVGTYVEVECDRTIDWKRVVFKIPLDPESFSYDVKGGCHYNLAIDLKTDGENTDYVPFPKSIDYDSSNCYLINPYTSGIGTMFSFPIDKVNDYWKELATPQDGFDMNTEWKVEVIWQDMPAQIIQFYQSENNPSNDFKGVGTKQRVYFKFTDQVGNTTFDDVRNHGNIVVGIRKRLPDETYEDKYRWSWHLWITNYNPNSAKKPDPQWEDSYPNHVWKVDGGEVHRYSDPLNTTDGVWAVDYKDSYIMDRSIGAFGNSRGYQGGDKYKIGGLYYQYGRKDPFPAQIDVYNINGEKIENFINVSHTIDPTEKIVILPRHEDGPKTSIEEAIHYPYVFYHGNIGGDWVSNNPYYKTNWNYPGDERDMSHKSLFDPCPLGWKVVRSGAWLIFSKEFSGDDFSKAFVRNDEHPEGIYIKHQTNEVENMNVKTNDPFETTNGTHNGWYFYIADENTGPTAYYAANCYRAYHNGEVWTEANDITAWSIDGGLGNPNVSGDNITWAYHLDAYKDNITLPDNDNRAYGLPVRCVRQDKDE